MTSSLDIHLSSDAVEVNDIQDLPMDNSALLVEVFQGVGNLRDDMSRQVLAKVRESHNLVEQLATGCQLENDVVVLPRLGEIDQFNDIGVIKLSHDLYFLKNICALHNIVSRGCIDILMNVA